MSGSELAIKSKGKNLYPYNPRDRRKAMETELNLLMKKHGGVLTAADVVVQAEDPTSALHAFFTWDDDEAAHKYRLIEARQLITSIRIIQEGQKGKIRSLVSLNVDRVKGGGYRALDEVLAQPALRQHLLETALSEFSALERKYKHLQELESIWIDVAGVKGEIASGRPKDGE